MPGKKRASGSSCDTAIRDYLDLVRLCFVELDQKQNVRLVNKAACDLLNRPESEIVGANWFDTCLPERIREEVKSVYRRLIGGDIAPVEYFENPVVTAEGEERIVAWHNTILRDDHGDIRGTISAGEDITERKNYEERLEASRRNYQAIFNNVNDMIVVHDAESGRILDVNQQAVERFGYEREELCRIGVAGISAADDKTNVVEERARDVIRRAAGGEPQCMEWLCKDNNGRTFWADVALSRVLHNNEYCVLAVVRDISQKKEYEASLQSTLQQLRAGEQQLKSANQQLRASEQQLRATNQQLRASQEALLHAEAERTASLNSTYEVIVYMDLNKRINWANRAAGESVGRPAAELTGLFCYAVWGDGAECRACPVTKALSSGKPCRGEMTTPDGRIWNIQADLVRDADNNIIGMVESTQEITRQRLLEEQLHQSEKMQAIGQLAGGIAHDFNNQLAGMLGYADMLREDVGDDATLSRYADNIIIATKRCSELTNQLLAFARKGKYLSVPVDVHRVILEVVSLLRHSIDKRITIRQQLNADPPTMKGDPSQIQNALLNLALNARDAMPEGGILTFSTFTTYLDDDFCDNHQFELLPGYFLHLTVSDTGTGMDSDILSHVFEPFFTTKEQGKGTGMGLAAVYGTVRSHKGAINISSEKSNGTTVTLYLPLHDRGKRSPLPNEEEQGKPIRGTGHILVVDDEEMVCDMARDMLSGLGYRVTLCRNGAEAVAYYTENHDHVDLVLLDVIMPKLGGKDTFHALRSINPGVKVVLCSGYSINGDAEQMIAQGAQSFVQKPFRKLSLSRTIAEVLSEG